MDRELSKAELKRMRLKRLIRYSIAGILVLIVVICILYALQSRVKRSDLIFSTVDKGTIELSYTASGIVTPAFEEIINSPIDSRVLQIYRKSGDSVNIGTPILKLDLQNAKTDLSKMLDEKEMKAYELQQLKINNQTALSDMLMKIRVSVMKVNRLEVELRNERYLDSLGSGTTDKVREVEMNYRTGKLELQQLREGYRNEKQVKAADVKAKELEYNILNKNLDNMRRTLVDAQIRSPRKAILTYINNQIGVQVAQGSKVAVISDLSHFKVDCEIADSYSSHVVVGGKAIVNIGSKQYEGVISNVTPLSQNGVIDFTVQLKEDNAPSFRSGLKTNVYVMSTVKENVLRIVNGSYYSNNPDEYELFVLDGSNKLVKRKVQLGDSNFEYVEVLGGLHQGDKVVVSDMSNYKDKKKLRIE
jgi:HlyD family secretion protein